MNIASLVLGIIALLFSFIPLLGTIAYLPAILAIIFGLIVIFKKSKGDTEKPKKGMGIAGLVIAIVSIILVNSMNSAIIDSVNELVSDNIVVIDNNSSASTENNSASENNTCKVGQSIQNKDFKITFISADDNFTGYNKYATIKSGHKVVKADFEFENISSSDQLASSLDFSCYADGYSCDEFWSVDDPTFSSTLSSGKKSKGSVYFEVPVNANSITLEYESDIWTNSKLIFVIK